MREAWKPIPDFPRYAISNFGRVLNVETDLIKTPSPNQQGIPSVSFVKDRVQYRRSVAKLVAEAFLDKREKYPQFNTPIHLDGDRFNCHVDNLVWRPLWFASRYHAQMKLGIPYGFTAAVRCVDTGEEYQDVMEAAVSRGMLMKDIILSIQNRAPVFPTWEYFEIIA